MIPSRMRLPLFLISCTILALPPSLGASSVAARTQHGVQCGRGDRHKPYQPLRKARRHKLRHVVLTSPSVKKPAFTVQVPPLFNVMPTPMIFSGPYHFIESRSSHHSISSVTADSPPIIIDDAYRIGTDCFSGTLHLTRQSDRFQPVAHHLAVSKSARCMTCFYGMVSDWDMQACHGVISGILRATPGSGLSPCRPV